MKEIGKILKKAREDKKLSTVDIHKTIKIKESYVVALESDNVDEFPAELYYKNFLKSYAKFLNLNADELLANYELAKKEQKKTEIKEKTQNINVNKKIQKKLIVTLIIAAIMCVGLIVFDFLLSNHCPAKVESVENVKISTTTDIAPQKIEVPPQIKKQKLLIKTIGNTWISLDADNKNIFREMVLKGDSREFFADNNFVLKIGNVSNALVYFNDQEVDIVSGASKNHVNSITLKKAEEKPLE